MINCPNGHHIAYLYKQFLPDGKVKICCNHSGCNWESEPFEKEEHKHIETMPEKKKSWQ